MILRKVTPSIFVAVIILIAAAIFACGSDNATVQGLDDGGGGATDGGSNGDDGNGFPGTDGGHRGGPLCRGRGVACDRGDQCCTGTCDATSKQCTGVGACGLVGAKCVRGTDCCNLHCGADGLCGEAACISDNQTCTNGKDCCSGTCNGGKCTPLNTNCSTAGNSCANNDQCCSKLCQGGKCQLASSYCIQSGDVCSNSADCCGGVCNISSSTGLGTCAPAPTGPSNCNGGVDGTVCNGDCTQCCSRLCAPYGPSGVTICQPANGCRVVGDLCRQDSDCCGAAGTDLPGSGNVTCVKATGAAVGICRNPMGCKPEGDVCHFKNYTCSISAAANSCCEHLGHATDCSLDPIGVPRCHVVGADGGLACHQIGDFCAFSGDCCNGDPCLPDPSGILRCATPTTTKCSAVDGACSINGDCCDGLLCIEQPGSVKGTCKQPTTGGGGGSDAGTPPPSCGLYGQQCQQNSDCCNNVPCINNICSELIH